MDATRRNDGSCQALAFRQGVIRTDARNVSYRFFAVFHYPDQLLVDDPVLYPV